MRVAIIGLGSMGRRRARLIHEVDQSIEVIGVDLQDSRRARFLDDGLGAFVFPSLSAALQHGSLQAAFVCTSPISHSTVTKECLHNGLHVFTEINLVDDGYSEIIGTAHDQGLVLFLSSTFLYRRETRWIINKAGMHAGGSYSYHVGQYLPDWHPWESYKDFFVADERTSGCRELFAIELPWLVAAFGPVVSVKCMCGHQSSLELPYNDTYAVLLEHEKGAVGQLTVDVVCRKPVRRFEYSHEDAYITWDGTPDTLQQLDLQTGELERVELYPKGTGVNLDGYASFVIEDAYREEVTLFLDAVSGGRLPEYGFEQDADVLALIDRIEGKI